MNVKGYGAVRAGSTDDTSAIAIANALTSGRSVLFPVGTHLTSAQSISSAGQIRFELRLLPMTVAITPAGNAQYVIANWSAGTKIPTARTQDIDIFKRTY
jgi:Pectate lyase superfamily protein